MTEKQATESWPWHWAPFEDEYWVGPFDSRELAIEAGKQEREDSGFYVAQAINAPIKLSDWIGADDLIERADESIFDSDRVSSEFDDIVFTATKAQQQDLAARVKRACDEWQEAHGLSFHASTFAEMTPPERITASERSA
ncbi:hypothetical protein [Falsigemmobacter faecalis]|uniref:Uncharacterized protein n=1 Tax=Falsigemmobacter faecalis TaxID=2488730 RepID=A0A3P3DHH6_9RHOB|nr:hypothetical protein [Falsigemmobacter faecalis]RRH72028.1 hypothetical protein EG244_16065 [Falsigemmobacter faecalis]